MNIRPMNTGELVDYFGSAVLHRGFIAEDRGQWVGSVGYSVTDQDGFYCHSLYCDDRHPYAFASLHQRLAREARQQGFTAARYAIDGDNKTLSRIAERAGDRPIRILYERRL